MKRIWFAIIFLIVAAAMCTGEQLYIKELYTDMNEKISTAEAALKSGDTDKYEKTAKEITELWDERNDILYAISEHAGLDDIAVEIRSAPYNKGDELKELHSLRAQLYAYYENEKISFANIF